MLKFISSIVGGLVVLGAVSASAQAQMPNMTLPGTRVTITGCVYYEPGFGGACYGIRDMRTGQSYQINAAMPKPNMFRAVRLTGVVSGLLDHCMMGPVLGQIRWTPAPMRCPVRRGAN